MRLLIVEDELPMRTALVETLSSEGYRVRAADDASEDLSWPAPSPSISSFWM